MEKLEIIRLGMGLGFGGIIGAFLGVAALRLSCVAWDMAEKLIMAGLRRLRGSE